MHIESTCNHVKLRDYFNGAHRSTEWWDMCPAEVCGSLSVFGALREMRSLAQTL